MNDLESGYAINIYLFFLFPLHTWFNQIDSHKMNGPSQFLTHTHSIASIRCKQFKQCLVLSRYKIKNIKLIWIKSCALSNEIISKYQAFHLLSFKQCIKHGYCACCEVSVIKVFLWHRSRKKMSMRCAFNKLQVILNFTIGIICASELEFKYDAKGENNLFWLNAKYSGNWMELCEWQLN